MELSQDGLLEVADNVVAENLISRNTLVIKDNYRIVELNLEDFGSRTLKYIKVAPVVSGGCFRGTFFGSRTGSGNFNSIDGKLTVSFGSNLTTKANFEFTTSDVARLSMNVFQTNYDSPAENFVILRISGSNNHLPRFMTFYGESNGFEIIGDSDIDFNDLTTLTIESNKFINGGLSVTGNFNAGEVQQTDGDDRLMKYKRFNITQNMTNYGIGDIVQANHTSAINRNASVDVYLSGNTGFVINTSGTKLNGNWRAKGSTPYIEPITFFVRHSILCQRIS
jgi:hypothetical protein